MEEEFDLNQKKLKRDKRNNKTKEPDTDERETKEGDLKSSKEISKNVHIKPAEEQQFENNN